MTSQGASQASQASSENDAAHTPWAAVSALAGMLGIRMLGLFMVLPVLALYAEELPGGTPLMVGLALGIYGLTQALLQIPMGRLSDRIGRLPVIAAGLLVFVSGSLLAALADTAATLVLGRALQGAGAISAAVTALVGDLVPASRRTRAMALLGIAIGMAFLLAFIVGPLLASLVGVSGLFWVAAALGGACMFVLLPIRGLAAHHIGAENPVLRRGIWSSLPAVLPEVLMVLALHALLTASFLLLPKLIVVRLGLPSAEHGWVYLPVMLGSVLVMGPLILLQERRSAPLALFLAVTLLGVGIAAWLLPDGKWPLYAGLLAFFGGFNFVEAHLPARVSLKAEGGDRGTAMGWYATGQFLGAFLGGALGGLLMGWGGEPAILAGLLGLVIAWIASLGWSLAKG